MLLGGTERKESGHCEKKTELESGNLHLSVGITLQSYFLTDFHGLLSFGLVPGLDTNQACPLPSASVV